MLHLKFPAALPATLPTIQKMGFVDDFQRSDGGLTTTSDGSPWSKSLWTSGDAALITYNQRLAPYENATGGQGMTCVETGSQSGRLEGRYSVLGTDQGARLGFRGRAVRDEDGANVNANNSLMVTFMNTAGGSEIRVYARWIGATNIIAAATTSLSYSLLNRLVAVVKNGNLLTVEVDGVPVLDKFDLTTVGQNYDYATQWGVYTAANVNPWRLDYLRFLPA